MRPRADHQQGPAPDVTLHLLDEAGVLFNAGTHQLYSLNTTATYVWCCLEEGFGPARIEHGLEQTFGFDPDAAKAHLGTILRQWQDLGLLRQTTGGSLGAPATSDTVTLRLLDTAFRLQASPGDLLSDLTPLVEHLVITEASDALTIQITADRDGFILQGPDGAIERCQRRDQLAPLVKISLVRFALRHGRAAYAIHAAGVTLGERCLLLPGASGSGKSTLAAALVMAGCGLLGDDTIVLAHDTLAARQMPFAICLKPGAWRLLRKQLPQLAQQPIHNRPDGKRVRYLLPAETAPRIAPDVQTPVEWIVFPRRIRESPAELVPLSRAEALARLLHECCPLDTLDPEKIAQLVQWIAAISCFELRFSGLDAAVERLRRLAP